MEELPESKWMASSGRGHMARKLVVSSPSCRRPRLSSALLCSGDWWRGDAQPRPKLGHWVLGVGTWKAPVVALLHQANHAHSARLGGAAATAGRSEWPPWHQNSSRSTGHGEHQRCEPKWLFHRQSETFPPQPPPVPPKLGKSPPRVATTESADSMYQMGLGMVSQPVKMRPPKSRRMTKQLSRVSPA